MNTLLTRGLRKRVFLSFIEEDKEHVQGLRLLAANPNYDLEFLGCDLTAVVEVQPRANEPNRLNQIRDRLTGATGGPWQADQTDIEYDTPTDAFGNLQLGLLWNSGKVTVNPSADQLLLELRQPRDAAGTLTEKRMRAPWLIPVRAGSLDFDLLVLHLKSRKRCHRVTAFETNSIAGGNCHGSQHRAT